MSHELEFSAQAFSKIVMHSMKYPHCVCSGLLLSPRREIGIEKDKDEKELLTIAEAIPVSHASQCLTANVDIALHALKSYAQKQDMIISGYYQTDRPNEQGEPDLFSQRMMDKISNLFPKPVLCYLKFNESLSKSILNPHQYIDGKLRQLNSNSFSVDCDTEFIAEKVLYSRENMYREIIDFDEHFNDISLDWTNAAIGCRIDEI